ncbi:hypothetical protein QVA66_11775 [Staphylococcus chromogenes]|nr:hypothetical protein [Staphylococcus chromogenes]
MVLSEFVLNPEEPQRKAKLLVKLEHLVESSIAEQQGIRGLAIKGAVMSVQKVRPDAIPFALSLALSDILRALDPYWEAKDTAFGSYLESRKDEVTADLLAVVDRLAADKGGSAERTFQAVRGRAKTIVENHVSDLGEIVEESTK